MGRRTDWIRQEMGTGIAKSLLRAGHRVTVLPTGRVSAPRRCIKTGATVAGSVAEACGGDAVFTMLADDACAGGDCLWRRRRVEKPACRAAAYMHR